MASPHETKIFNSTENSNTPPGASTPIGEPEVRKVKSENGRVKSSTMKRKENLRKAKGPDDSHRSQTRLPPVDLPEVYKEIFEQAENFKKNR